jgi:hypothetical protein
MTKYYILKRNNETVLRDYILELSPELRDKKFNDTSYLNDLILIEKTCNKNVSEFISNVWTMNEGVPSLWQKFTKGRLTYDYTGIVYPLIHENGIVKLFHQHFYNEETKF